MHFTSAVHNTAFTKVLGYAELCSGTGDGSFHKRQYNDLCKVNDETSFRTFSNDHFSGLVWLTRP